MDTQTSVAGNTRSGGDYITVDGVRTYFEVTGTGEPLLLLHGGLMTAESWDPQVPTVAYGNAASDLEHLQLAQHGILVNGSHSARQMAARLGVRSVTWR